MRYFLSIILIFCFVALAPAQANREAQANVLGRAVFDIIEKARNQLEAGDLAPAKAQIEKLLARPISAYEGAIARQILAAILTAENDYDGAIKALRHIEQTPHLPPALQNDVLYHLAQSHLAAQKPKQAQDYLDKWFGRIQKNRQSAPRPHIYAPAYALQAYIYYALEEWQGAQKAITRALKAEKQPPKNWLQLHIVLYLKQEDYKKARPILERAVILYPDAKIFWQQLTASYSALGKEDLAFATYKTMYQQNMLRSSQEQVRLAQFYLYHNIPLRAAEILEAGFASAIIKKTDSHYGLLADAYQRARHWQKSLAPLQKAAALSDKGTYHAKLGFAYSHNEEWDKAADAFAAAIEKNQLNNKDKNKDENSDIYLRLGLAYMHSGKYNAAIRALRQAGNDDALAAQAFQWIRIIEARLNVPTF